jgi:hypothetical protein
MTRMFTDERLETPNMIRFSTRRIRNIGLTMIALAVVWLWVSALQKRLVASSFTTGYLLIAAVLFLALYNVRKKLPFLPIGTSATWLQWHIYVGVASIGVFVLHAGLRLPTGVLNTTLYVIYSLTIFSGIVGLYLTRTIPRQLARVGEEVVFERIPALHRDVQRQASELVLHSVTTSGVTTLADFYVAHLYDFFGVRRGLSYFLRPTTALRRSLMGEMQNLRRYLCEPELAACERLFALVRRKDDLDFHAARQGLLKTWLFVHIALSYTLMVLATLHGLLALAFRGGGA